ncbi:zinc finger and BTB domain-containing protein 17 [Clonorchis sinensis]|uniref:Zinc finger and BTB domain-containing protein 17 n=1 Tax=Clonorchis sinensis TaxID=79923 RepID=G7YU92_CLOSI|nr:zinc finger and BTB domain-containing protein 17 [Clonorchis sinensis]
MQDERTPQIFRVLADANEDKTSVQTAIDISSETSSSESISKKTKHKGSGEDAKLPATSHRCPQCPKVFTFSCWLRRHMESHLKERQHMCDFCPSSFKSLVGKKGHMIQRHWKELESSKPEEPTVYSELLKREGHICHYCEKRFCSKTVLDKHLPVHSRSRPYACQVCGYRYRDPGILTRHTRACRRDNT